MTNTDTCSIRELKRASALDSSVRIESRAEGPSCSIDEVTETLTGIFSIGTGNKNFATGKPKAEGLCLEPLSEHQITTSIGRFRQRFIDRLAVELMRDAKFECVIIDF